MKIERFNESYQGNKLIKRYNNSILAKFLKEQKEFEQKIKKDKENILNLINEFIKLNKDYYYKKYNCWKKIDDFRFYIDEDTNKPELALIMGKYNNDVIHPIYKDINSLFDFLENPDLYRNSNKYNL